MLRIHCPYCGVRDHEEFSYFGDATKHYPALSLEPSPEHHAAWVEAVFMRDNPKGEHHELWQHTLACRRWLVVKRHTVTHDILAVMPAHQRPVHAATAAGNSAQHGSQATGGAA